MVVKMHIRPATKADIQPMSLLISSLVTEFILPTCTEQGAQILINSMDQGSIKHYFDSGYQYNVALIDDTIVGVVGIRDNSHLYHLFVAKSHQGKGISKTLWDHAKQQAIDNGNAGFFTVNSALNATELYLKWGFVPLSGIRERSGIKDIPMRLML